MVFDVCRLLLIDCWLLFGGVCFVLMVVGCCV